MAELLLSDKKTASGAPSSIGSQMYSVTYDFAVDGGTTTDTRVLIEFKDACAIRMVAARAKTTVTSGGSATISLGVAAGTEFLSGAAIAGFAAGAIVNQTTAGEFYKVEADEKIVLSIGVADLTAGKIEFMFEVIAA